jgi:hypothetical protein
MGDYIYESVNACTDIFVDNYSLTVSLAIGGDSKNTVSFMSSPEYYGTLIDQRSGSAKTTRVNTAEDLIKTFPAFQNYLTKENKSDSGEWALYDEIMGILNSDYSRSEDEIIKEIAPKYNMTPAEMKEFLTEMLKKIYS